MLWGTVETLKDDDTAALTEGLAPKFPPMEIVERIFVADETDLYATRINPKPCVLGDI